MSKNVIMGEIDGNLTGVGVLTSSVCSLRDLYLGNVGRNFNVAKKVYHFLGRKAGDVVGSRRRQDAQEIHHFTRQGSWRSLRSV